MPKTIHYAADGTITEIPDPRPLTEQQAEQLETMAEARGQATRDNFSFNGVKVTLTRETEDAISKAYSALGRKPPGSVINWEVERGLFMDFDLAAISALADAAFDHVQACFSHSKTLTQAIMGATTADELDAISVWEGWPDSDSTLL